MAIQKLWPGPLSQVRGDRFCHRSKLYLVSGVRFQVSVNTETWTLIWLQLKAKSSERKPISWVDAIRRVEFGCWNLKPETWTLRVYVITHITPPRWTKAGLSGPGYLLSSFTPKPATVKQASNIAGSNHEPVNSCKTLWENLFGLTSFSTCWYLRNIWKIWYKKLSGATSWREAA